MINASPYDNLYIGTIYDPDDGHSIIDVWAVYAKNPHEASNEFRRRMIEKGHYGIYFLKMASICRMDGGN